MLGIECTGSAPMAVQVCFSNPPTRPPAQPLDSISDIKQTLSPALCRDLQGSSANSELEHKVRGGLSRTPSWPAAQVLELMERRGSGG